MSIPPRMHHQSMNRWTTLPQSLQLIQTHDLGPPWINQSKPKIRHIPTHTHHMNHQRMYANLAMLQNCCWRSVLLLDLVKRTQRKGLLLSRGLSVPVPHTISWFLSIREKGQTKQSLFIMSRNPTDLKQRRSCIQLEVGLWQCCGHSTSILP
jgi:hypothetical protein